MSSTPHRPIPRAPLLTPLALALLAGVLVAACGAPAGTGGPPTSAAALTTARAIVTPADAAAGAGAAGSAADDADLTVPAPERLGDAPSRPTPAAGADLVWQANGAPEPLARPTALAVTPQGQLAVVDAGNDRVRTVDRDGRFLTGWGDAGQGPGQFVFRRWAGGRSPVGGGVAVDARGAAYVVDPFNARIQVFDDRQRFVTMWGGPGGAAGQFRFVSTGVCDDSGGQRVCATEAGGGVAVDAAGDVYVADWGNHRVQVFDRRGRALRQWGGPGADEGEFHHPTAVVVDRHGRVYVADSGNQRIQAFDRAGRFLTGWGGPGGRAGEFGDTVLLTVDGEGRVYVADPSNHRAQVFDRVGNLLLAWDIPGTPSGPAAAAGGIAVDGYGDVYVTDTANGRLLKFRLRAALPAALGTTPTPRPATPVPPTPTLAPLPSMTPTDR